MIKSVLSWIKINLMVWNLYRITSWGLGFHFEDKNAKIHKNDKNVTCFVSKNVNFYLISVLKDANLKEIKCGITIDMLLIITLKLLVELHKEQK